ncbi:hemogen isoform X2 [Clinocottus analis]|uniref:hemogen isoform X2 n=1 Tax=Clinocottus analis TaxID=304258 RepID=UPI0035BFACEF
MEETLQQEKPELEYQHSNEDQGGIHRRLRDRNLIRKRKAEAEEKETNQVQSQRKKPRPESSIKRRGRPKKNEPTPEISTIQEEAVPQEAPALVVPEPAEIIPDQTPSSLSPLFDVESQPSSVPAAPVPRPLFQSIQTSIFAPTLTSPASVKPTPDPFSLSALVPSPVKVPDMAPVPFPDSAAAPDVVPILTQASAAAAAAPLQEETIFTESQCREALDQVLIRDLGADEEDVTSTQDKTPNEDLIGASSNNVPEQNKMFSIPTLSPTPPPQKYFPDNLF